MTEKAQPKVNRGPKKKDQNELVIPVGTTCKRSDKNLIEDRRGPLADILREYIKELVVKIQQSESENK